MTIWDYLGPSVFFMGAMLGLLLTPYKRWMDLSLLGAFVLYSASVIATRPPQAKAIASLLLFSAIAIRFLIRRKQQAHI